MPRSDTDSWNITESVGATALCVAAARAAETESADPLIRDPFARTFVKAAGDGVWSLYGDPALLGPGSELEPDLQDIIRATDNFMATRTAFFDDFMVGAAESGIRQIVILASGLDVRTWRLSWPEGTVVYELDQPQVLEFKSATLRGLGATPHARLVEVAVDLRQDWPTALREAGFDPAQPSAWLAEGLVRYLPAAAQDQLFERVLSLSAPGSRLASNVPGEGFNDPERVQAQRDGSRRLQAVAAQLFHTEVVDITELWYAEERSRMDDWLRDRGWQVDTALTLEQLLADYGRAMPDEPAGGVPPTLFVAAQRPPV